MIGFAEMNSVRIISGGFSKFRAQDEDMHGA
jgi:hypothetical protein